MSGTMILGAIALVSVALNALLLWYGLELLAKLLYTSDNLGDLFISCRSYEEFLKKIYEMEMFYGEPILEDLIKRTKLIREEIEQFEQIYELTTDIEIINEEETDDYQEKTVEET
tara:strand:+ start:7579 stop:7923 length:345 start_codon:yes stop_codon:yes gene_type:complete